MKVFNCKTCGAPMVWIKTKAGKNMPCDAQPYDYQENYKGKDTIVTEDGRVLKATILRKHVENPDPTIAALFTCSNGLTAVIDGVGYKPHWATCPFAPYHRKTAAELNQQGGGGNV